ncbi:hypothetical protein AB2E99_25255 (plasmid) [Escherichia coli]
MEGKRLAVMDAAGSTGEPVARTGKPVDEPSPLLRIWLKTGTTRTYRPKVKGTAVSGLD